MLQDAHIAFIGPGAMAEAMIRGVVVGELVSPSQVVAAGPRSARLEELQAKYAIHISTDNLSAAQSAEIIVLAVKPQMMNPVMQGLKGHLRPNALALSVIAGARMQTIENSLNHHAIARAMPNTPAMIGQGMTVWTASSSVTMAQREQAQRILGALGQEIFVEEEEYLDMATALSGNGPAYVFLFMEAMVDAGVHLGFPRYIAEKLVLQTVKGSVEYAAQTPQHLARLRNQVTSPGGTSAEALYYLEKAGFRTALSRAIWAAYQRASQLGRGKKRNVQDE
ncbi:MAG: pyrroline-5-carboxylate reductase [Chloroflexi bacterium UTCFX4]|jgi:pyrroline-5-carboxylate reductase|nr:MAG: pyrroline-5-carboxylate reductase [Chloroflexi bacterium UTCFX4]